MTKQIIEIGSSANDGTGDTLRTGAQKINANFTELYNSIYALPAAGVGSEGTLGGVKVDGTSVVINNGVISSTIAGSVVGPASATDNAITRFNTTTGKLLQNSVVTISDLGAIVAPIASSIIPFHYDNQAGFPSAVTYHGAIAHSHADGKMYFAHGGVWLALANASDVPAAQVQSDWNAISGLGEILNKPTITAIPTQTSNAGKYLTTDGSALSWATVTGGTQVQSDWTQASNVALDYIKNKPTIPAEATWPVLNTTGSSGPQNVAIGENVHQTFTYTPGFGTVAIGYAAGRDNQGGLTVAVGWQAGQSNQSNNAIAIGYAAGQTSQEDGAVAIGAFAGNQLQGADAIAIGKYAGYNGVGVAQPDNTIFLNATGAHMGGVAAQTNSFYVAPIRDTTPTAKGMFYNATTKEITTATLATVATSGSYDDLASKPAIPSAYSATSINALSDVDTVTSVPTAGQPLVWNAVSSSWVPGSVISGSLSTLSGVTITSPVVGHVLKYNGSVWINDADAVSGGAGVGTVTNVSVASANGFSGSVATSSSTPDITIGTSITGVLRGTGTAITAATSGTDFAPGTSALTTGIVKSTTTTGALSIAVAGTDYQAPIGTISGIVKGNGANALTAAVAGTDYQAAQSVTGIVKSSGTTRSAAVAGTDYIAPYASQAANTHLAAPSGAAGTPAFRLLTSADIPSTLGATAHSGSVTLNGSANLIFTGSTSGTVTFVAGINPTIQSYTLPSAYPSITGYVLSSTTLGVLSWTNQISGVTNVSVVSANGFAATIATPSSTPAITITTSITGMLKGNATAISAAVAGTDYQAPIGTISGVVKGNGANALTAAVSGTDYQAPIGTISGLVKGNGANALTAAVAGTDYQAAQSVTGIVKSSGTTRSAAVAGTDYQAPITLTTTGSSGAATFSSNTLNIPQYVSGATAFSGLSDATSASLTVDKIYLPAITKLVVTANGSSAYRFDQYGTTDDPTIYAISGTTIAFDLGTGALSSHPFLIRTSGGTNYDTGLVHVSTAGVVTTGSSAQGKTSGTLYWKIPASTTGNYQYICSAHGLMVGTITISPPAITRTAVNGTTASLATSATGNLTITGYKGYFLYKIQISAAAWVRIYTDTASRTADAGRTELTDPTPGAGVIAEVITTGAETILISPGVMGFSNESTPSTNIELAVTNKSGGTTTITVTLTVLPLEA